MFCSFTPRLAGPLDFPRPAGGVLIPTSISTPAHHKAKRKTELESSSGLLRTTSVVFWVKLKLISPPVVKIGYISLNFRSI